MKALKYLVLLSLLLSTFFSQLNALDLAYDTFTSNSSDGYSRDDGWKNQLKVKGKKKSYKIYDFTSAYANSAVEVTFRMKWKGDWENSGTWQDYFKVSFNDTQLINDTFSGDASSWHNYTQSVTTDSDGKLKIEFYANSTSNGEYIVIDDVKIVSNTSVVIIGGCDNTLDNTVANNTSPGALISSMNDITTDTTACISGYSEDGTADKQDYYHFRVAINGTLNITTSSPNSEAYHLIIGSTQNGNEYYGDNTAISHTIPQISLHAGDSVYIQARETGSELDEYQINFNFQAAAIVENADDLCYEDHISSGLMCFDMGICSGGIGCQNTYPLKNIGDNTLSNVQAIYDESAMGGGMFSSCGVDPSGTCTQKSGLDMGPIGIFGNVTTFNLANSIPINDNSNSIWTKMMMSGQCFGGDKLYATYIKDGVMHRGKLQQCDAPPPPPDDETVPDEDNNLTEPICDAFADMFQTHGTCSGTSGGTINFNNAGSTLDGSSNIIIDNTDNSLNTCEVTTPTWVSNQYQTCGTQGDCEETGQSANPLTINYNNPPSTAFVPNTPSSSNTDLVLSTSQTLSDYKYNTVTTDWHTGIATTFDITNSLKINSLRMTTDNTFTFQSSSGPYSLDIGTLGVENNGERNTIQTDLNAKNIKIHTFSLPSEIYLNLTASQTIKMDSLSIGHGSTTVLKAQYVNINTLTSSNSGSGDSVINIYADYIDISTLALGETVTLNIYPFTTGQRVLFRTNTLTESSSSSILMSSGNYYINTSLTIPGTSDVSALRAMDANALINLYLNSDLTLGNNPGINAEGNNGNYTTAFPAANFMFFINGDLTTGGGGTTINATLYTEGDATLGNPTYIKGALSAHELIDVGQGQFIYDQSLDDGGFGECETAHEGDRDFVLVNNELSQNIIGNIQTIGNTNLCITTSSSGFGTCETGASTATDNERYVQYINIEADEGRNTINVDGASETVYNSSGATINVQTPTDNVVYEVVYAALFWQGSIHDWYHDQNWLFNNHTQNNIDLGNPEQFHQNEIALHFPQMAAGEYTKISTDSSSFYDYYNVYRDDYGGTTSRGGVYSVYVDITNKFNTFGDVHNPNGEYRIANLKTMKGRENNLGNYGGWSLVVIYDNKYDPLEKFRNLSVYSGYRVISAVHNTQATIPVSGFRTPETGSIDSSLSLFIGEAERYSGDYGKLVTPTGIHDLSDGASGTSSTNLYRGRITLPTGSTRDKSYQNTDGIDVRNFDVSNDMVNNQSSATIKIGTQGDTYFASMVTFATELYKPDICYDYSIKQNSHFFQVPLPDDEIPDLDMHVITGTPLDFNVYIKNREGDIEATQLSLHTDFRTTPLTGPTQMHYDTDSVSMTQVNGNLYTHYNDSSTLVNAAVDGTSVRMGIGKDPSTASVGGSLGNQESQYIQFSTLPTESHIDMQFKLYLDMVLRFNDSTEIIIPNFRLGPDIKPCAKSDVYLPEWGIFTAVDTQLNANINSDVSVNDNGNIFYNLRTQVADRPFQVDIIGLKESTTHLDPKLRTYWEKFDTNTTVEIELADMTQYHEFNATCGDSSNTLPGTTEFITFYDKEWKKTLQNQIIPYAKTNVSYRVWFLEDNETALVKHHCLTNNNSSCYDALYASRYAAFDSNCTASCVNSSGTACYDCLRGNYGHALCSRDNFAIRPEALNIMSINDTNNSLEVTEQNSTHYIAARYDYDIEINATGYTYTDNNISTHKGVPGYVQSFNNDGNTVSIFDWNNSNSVSCNDKSDSNVSLSFTTLPAYSVSDCTAQTINSGFYQFQARDYSWTNLDKYAYATHHSLIMTRDFFQSNTDDCVLHSTEVPLTWENRAGQETRVGCDISTSHAKKADNYNYTINGTVYNMLLPAALFNDLNVTARPHHFTFTDKTLSYDASQYIDNSPANMSYIYTNSIDENDSNLSMSSHFEKTLSAEGGDDTVLSNFTSTCNAEDMKFPLSIEIQNCGTLPVQNDFKYRIISKHSIDDTNLTDTNSTFFESDSIQLARYSSDGNISLSKTAFSDDLNGSTDIEINANFNHIVNAPNNPITITYKQIDITCENLSDCNITADGTQHTVRNSVNLNDKNTTYLYARAHTDKQRYEGSTGNALIYYESFSDASCNRSVLPDGTASIPSTTSMNWYRNSTHDSSLQGRVFSINQFRSQNKVTATLPNLNNPSSTTLTYDESRGYPYKTKMLLNVSEWLLYHPFDATATANSFQVEFYKVGGTWTGAHETNTTTDSNAAGITNKRIIW